MKRATAALAIVATLLGAVVTETASAHGRVGVGIGFGFGGYYPGYWGWPGWYAPYPYYSPYYYGPVVTTAPEPTRYIERGDNVEAAPAAAPRRDWWYFCPESKTYYPYVKQCAGGWQRVEPRPQDESTNPER